eukprot:1156761-Pelagomonas_calceolata.AAC.3
MCSCHLCELGIFGEGLMAQQQALKRLVGLGAPKCCMLFLGIAIKRKPPVLDKVNPKTSSEPERAEPERAWIF